MGNEAEQAAPAAATLIVTRYAGLAFEHQQTAVGHGCDVRHAMVIVATGIPGPGLLHIIRKRSREAQLVIKLHEHEPPAVALDEERTLVHRPEVMRQGIIGERLQPAVWSHRRNHLAWDSQLAARERAVQSVLQHSIVGLPAHEDTAARGAVCHALGITLAVAGLGAETLVGDTLQFARL